MTNTTALCRLADMVSPVIQAEIENAAGDGRISPELARMWIIGLDATIREMCSKGQVQQARKMARSLGLDVQWSNGTPTLMMGDQPDSTRGGGGGLTGKFNQRHDDQHVCKPCASKGKRSCNCSSPIDDGGEECGDDGCAWIFEDSDDGGVNPTSVPIIPIGSANCKRYAENLAKCDIQRITRAESRPVFSARTDNNTLKIATFPMLGLPQTEGYTWYRLEVPAIAVSHYLCPRRVTVKNRGGFKVEVEMVAIAAQITTEAGNGSYTEAWDYPKPEDPEYFTIKDGRCECAQLCACIAADKMAAIYLQLPTLEGLDSYSVTIKAERNRWCQVCGPCPPPKICDREPIKACPQPVASGQATNNCLPCNTPTPQQTPPQLPPPT